MLRIVVTGGTFEKRYDAVTGMLTFGESHLPALLQRARVTAPVTVEVTHLIDSLEMTDEDRRRVVATCAAADEAQIVVIHGTDTMTETARALGVLALPKTIVLTGAMVPYTVHGSDSEFNLGFALAAAQLLPHGVYIAMNGHWFPWNQVVKNRAAGVFEALTYPSATPHTLEVRGPHDAPHTL
jgi:L-asparaginase